MTASAIEGDREKCLDSGMNNYLAKPVRAQTLKALLESYLNKEQEGKDSPELTIEAKNLVKQTLAETDSAADTGSNEVLVARRAINGEDVEDGEAKSTSRPLSIRTVTAQRIPLVGDDEKSPPL